MASPAATADGVDLSMGIVKGGRFVPCRACDTTADEVPMRFTVVSVFGDQPLARCVLEFRMRIGLRGGLVLSNVANSPFASKVSGPCGDILACRRNAAGPETEKLPWRGGLTASEGRALRADIDVCFDTCLGRFEGTTQLAFEQTPSGAWRLRAKAAPVGTSGLEITGSSTVQPTFGGRLAAKIQ
jgi:hypothetical protein